MIKYWADIKAVETNSMISPEISIEYHLIDQLPIRNKLLLNICACREITHLCIKNESLWNEILDIIENQLQSHLGNRLVDSAINYNDLFKINKEFLKERYCSQNYSGNRLVASAINCVTSTVSFRYNSLWFSALAKARYIFEKTSQIENTKEISTLNKILQNQNELLFPLFAPVKNWKKSWRNTNTIELTKNIYYDNAFELLPILADALMDEGCDNEEVLNILTSNNPYFCRGMWILEQLNEIS